SRRRRHTRLVSDWSSDVCSSDLIAHLKNGDAFARSAAVTKAEMAIDELLLALDHSVGAAFTRTLADLYDYVLRQIIKGHSQQSEIGRASCRERDEIGEVAGSLEK